jgi:tRNA A58 N-methylase Trm61
MVEHALLVSVANAERQFLVRSEGELHTDAGVINLEILRALEYGSTITTHLGTEFKVLKLVLTITILSSTQAQGRESWRSFWEASLNT